MLNILGYGCSTAAGPTVSDFFNGLIEGRDHSREFPQKTSQNIDFTPRLCKWPTDPKLTTTLDTLVSHMMLASEEVRRSFSGNIDAEKERRTLGVIFASTKGCTEDLVWNPESSRDYDPLTPVLDKFLKIAELTPETSLCVSSACSSVMGALYLAKNWINQKRVNTVLIVAADYMGPFVTHGFFSLRALTSKKCRPFDADRDGLQLGDGAAALLVGDQPAQFMISGIEFETEGYAVTRPSQTASGLRRVVEKALAGTMPDFSVAHGTGTIPNDQAEDSVLRNFISKDAFVTGVKWSIGHTLGASAALDIIAACEILRTQKTFSLANTENISPEFASPFLIGKQQRHLGTLKTALVTSLGFGGVQGAAVIKGVDL